MRDFVMSLCYIHVVGMLADVNSVFVLTDIFVHHHNEMRDEEEKFDAFFYSSQ